MENVNGLWAREIAEFVVAGRLPKEEPAATKTEETSGRIRAGVAESARSPRAAQID
jgi:hypothetical protein